MVATGTLRGRRRPRPGGILLATLLAVGVLVAGILYVTLGRDDDGDDTVVPLQEQPYVAPPGEVLPDASRRGLNDATAFDLEAQEPYDVTRREGLPAGATSPNTGGFDLPDGEIDARIAVERPKAFYVPEAGNGIVGGNDRDVDFDVPAGATHRGYEYNRWLDMNVLPGDDVQDDPLIIDLIPGVYP
jgi:hypothetical protein